MGHAQMKDYGHSSETIDTYNPATGELHKTYTCHTRDEAEELIEKTHTAFESWKQTSFDDRAKIFNKMAELLRDNQDEIALMMTKQMGKALKDGAGEIELCASICEYTAKNASEILANEEREFSEGTAIITFQPLGVILAMQPWNFPFYQVIRYAAANIMAGNTTVMKHAEICWESAHYIQDLFEQAGLPKNVFTAIYVQNELADSLIEHDKVRGVTLTGSSEAGKIVAKKAGEFLKKTVLELGGSDPYIILADADLDLAVKTCVQGRVNNAGQTCVAAKRFIVMDEVYDEFKEKFVDAMKNTKHGDPMDEETDFGPMARQDLRENLHDQVQETIKKGANCLCGGKIPDGKGYYYPATVLEDIPKDSPAYKDELFGPVASLFRVKTEDEAIALANDHRYGLGGGIFSKNTERAAEIACTQMDTGMICVNGYALAQPNLPFGGVRESGYGREHGGYGMKEFVNIKSVMKIN